MSAVTMKADPEATQGLGHIRVLELLTDSSHPDDSEHPADTGAEAIDGSFTDGGEFTLLHESDPPRIAQFTAISGRKIPSEA